MSHSPDFQSARIPRRARSRSCPVEFLESRIAPAGFVEVGFSAGTLTLTGSDDDDGARIETDLLNHLIVTALPGTLLSGNVTTLIFPLPASGLLGITANLGAGADHLFLSEVTAKQDVGIDGGEGVNRISLAAVGARHLTVDGGAGNDDFTTQGLTLKGNLAVSLGDGDNTVYIGGTATKILGSLTYTGAGFDEFSLETDLQVKRGIVLNFSGSEAEVDIQEVLNVQGGLRLNGAAAGATIFRLYPQVAKITGDVVADLGPGQNEAVVGGFVSLEITGKLQLTGGAGNDVVSSVGSRLAVRGGITFDGGEGNNTFAPAVDFFHAGSLTVTGGAGNDRMELFFAEAAIKGATSLTLGDGENAFDAQGLGRLALGSFAYTGGAGTDDFQLKYQPQVKGATQVDLGAGANNLLLSSPNGSFAGPVTLRSVSTGADTSSLRMVSDALTFAKGLFVTETGDAVQTMQIRTFSALKLAGGFRFEGGAGTNEFEFSARAGQIAGPIVIDAGGGNDDVLLLFGVSSVKAPITITGAAGDDTIRLDGTGVVFSAPISIHAGDGDNAILLGRGDLPRVEFKKLVTVVSESTGADSLTSVMARFSGGLNATLGSGISTMRFNDVVLRGKTLLDTGAGNDDLQIERAGTRSISALEGVVEIRLGDGDDAALIGEGTLFNTIALLAKLTVDGGSGTDSINDVLALAQLGPGGTFTATNFP